MRQTVLPSDIQSKIDEFIATLAEVPDDDKKIKKLKAILDYIYNTWESSDNTHKEMIFEKLNEKILLSIFLLNRTIVPQNVINSLEESMLADEKYNDMYKYNAIRLFIEGWRSLRSKNSTPNTSSQTYYEDNQTRVTVSNTTSTRKVAENPVNSKEISFVMIKIYEFIEKLKLPGDDFSETKIAQLNDILEKLLSTYNNIVDDKFKTELLGYIKEISREKIAQMLLNNSDVTPYKINIVNYFERLFSTHPKYMQFFDYGKIKKLIETIKGNINHKQANQKRDANVRITSENTPSLHGSVLDSEVGVSLVRETNKSEVARDLPSDIQSKIDEFVAKLDGVGSSDYKVEILKTKLDEIYAQWNSSGFPDITRMISVKLTAAISRLLMNSNDASIPYIIHDLQLSLLTNEKYTGMYNHDVLSIIIGIKQPHENFQKTKSTPHQSKPSAKAVSAEVTKKTEPKPETFEADKQSRSSKTEIETEVESETEVEAESSLTAIKSMELHRKAENIKKEAEQIETENIEEKISFCIKEIAKKELLPEERIFILNIILDYLQHKCQWGFNYSNEVQKKLTKEIIEQLIEPGLLQSQINQLAALTISEKYYLMFDHKQLSPVLKIHLDNDLKECVDKKVARSKAFKQHMLQSKILNKSLQNILSDTEKQLSKNNAKVKSEAQKLKKTLRKLYKADKKEEKKRYKGKIRSIEIEYADKLSTMTDHLKEMSKKVLEVNTDILMKSKDLSTRKIHDQIQQYRQDLKELKESQGSKIKSSKDFIKDMHKKLDSTKKDLRELEKFLDLSYRIVQDQNSLRQLGICQQALRVSEMSMTLGATIEIDRKDREQFLISIGKFQNGFFERSISIEEQAKQGDKCISGLSALLKHWNSSKQLTENQLQNLSEIQSFIKQFNEAEEIHKKHDIKDQILQKVQSSTMDDLFQQHANALLTEQATNIISNFQTVEEMFNFIKEFYDANHKVRANLLPVATRVKDQLTKKMISFIQNENALDLFKDKSLELANFVNGNNQDYQYILDIQQLFAKPNIHHVKKIIESDYRSKFKYLQVRTADLEEELPAYIKISNKLKKGIKSLITKQNAETRRLEEKVKQELKNAKEKLDQDLKLNIKKIKDQLKEEKTKALEEEKLVHSSRLVALKSYIPSMVGINWQTSEVNRSKKEDLSKLQALHDQEVASIKDDFTKFQEQLLTLFLQEHDPEKEKAKNYKSIADFIKHEITEIQKSIKEDQKLSSKMKNTLKKQLKRYNSIMKLIGKTNGSQQLSSLLQAHSNTLSNMSIVGEAIPNSSSKEQHTNSFLKRTKSYLNGFFDRTKFVSEQHLEQQEEAEAVCSEIAQSIGVAVSPSTVVDDSTSFDKAQSNRSKVLKRLYQKSKQKLGNVYDKLKGVLGKSLPVPVNSNVSADFPAMQEPVSNPLVPHQPSSNPINNSNPIAFFNAPIFPHSSTHLNDVQGIPLSSIEPEKVIDIPIKTGTATTLSDDPLRFTIPTIPSSSLREANHPSQRKQEKSEVPSPVLPRLQGHTYGYESQQAIEPHSTTSHSSKSLAVNNTTHTRPVPYTVSSTAVNSPGKEVVFIAPSAPDVNGHIANNEQHNGGNSKPKKSYLKFEKLKQSFQKFFPTVSDKDAVYDQGKLQKDNANKFCKKKSSKDPQTSSFVNTESKDTYKIQYNYATVNGSANEIFCNLKLQNKNNKESVILGGATLLVLQDNQINVTNDEELLRKVNDFLNKSNNREVHISISDEIKKELQNQIMEQLKILRSKALISVLKRSFNSEVNISSDVLQMLPTNDLTKLHSTFKSNRLKWNEESDLAQHNTRSVM